MTVLVPANLKVQACDFNLVNQSAGGGVSATGFEQTIVNPGQRWRATLTLCVRTETEVLAYRGFLSSLDGRANDVLLGPRDGIRPRDGLGRPVPSLRAVPWSTRALWSTGAGWAAPAVDTGVVIKAAQQGATVITVRTPYGLVYGHYIGIADRLYRLHRVAQNADGVAWDLTIRPWLRADVAYGDPLLLARPACRMALASDDSGALDRAWKTAAYPKLDFVESVA